MAKLTAQQIIDSLKEMTILEINDLVYRNWIWC